MRNEPNPSRPNEGLTPLTHLVAKSLRRKIVNGIFPDETILPSERVLAERFNVSRTVVREATAHLVAEGLLVQADRCRRVVARPPAAQRGNGPLRFGVWLWPQADDYVASSIFRGIQQAAREGDLSLIVGTASHHSWDDDIASEARFIQSLIDAKSAEGVILWYLGGERNLPVLREARDAGIELVFVDRHPPQGFEADFVGTENVRSTRKAVTHLIELGHRTIAYVGNLDTASTVSERHLGYQRALRDAGLEVRNELTFSFSPRVGDTYPQTARRIAFDLLALNPRPTALFGVNDTVAHLLLEAFRELDVAVPGGMSIVGFDGLLHWIPNGGPLTTAAQNFSGMGECAGEALLRRLSGRSPSTYRHVLLDAPLSYGASTGPHLATPNSSLSFETARTQS